MRNYFEKEDYQNGEKYVRPKLSKPLSCQSSCEEFRGAQTCKNKDQDGKLRIKLNCDLPCPSPTPIQT